MAGTVDGGVAAAKTNKVRYGENFYRDIGKKGGHKGTTGGFYANKELARKVGVIGGRKSRRGPTKLSEEQKLRIAEIRAKLSQNIPTSVIARMYRVDVSTISNIHAGDIYKDTFVDSCLCSRCSGKRVAL